jgi:hypothetical protein
VFFVAERAMRQDHAARSIGSMPDGSSSCAGFHRLCDFQPLESLQPNPVSPASVDEHHQDALAGLTAKHGSRRKWIPVEVLAAHLCDRSASCACAARRADIVRKQVAQHTRRGVAVQPQLSFIHN